MRWGTFKKLIGVILLAVAAGCTTIEDRLARAQTIADVAQATADYYVQDALDESCSVAIVTTAGTVYAHAGSSDEHSLFRIASLSKLFLHPVLVKYDQTGTLDLDRPVTDVSKLSLPPEYRQVTLRDLLLNRSGLPREFIVWWEPVDMLKAFACAFTGGHIYADFDTREKFARMTWRPWWRHALHQRRPQYSNVGFGLLGTAVEDARGESLETILRTELATPLALSDTAYEPTGAQTNRLTRACAGHLPWFIRRKHEMPDHRLGDALRAAGGLFSSVADCATVFGAYWPLIEASLKERPLAAYAAGEMCGLLRVHVLPSGHRVLYRSGMIWGGSSFVGFDPDTRTIVVILRNVTSWPDKRGFSVLSRARLIQSPPQPRGEDFD